MTGKSLAAFAENWIVWVVLVPVFGVASGVLLWMAGHLDLWWPMTGGMVLPIGLGASAYAALIPVERAMRLGVDSRLFAFVAVNLVVSWGLSIAWGWALGNWAGLADRADPDFVDAVFVYATAIVCLWLTSNCIAQLFNGALYVFGSLLAGMGALILSAALA